MSRCVCTHIKALHRHGVCQAVVNPCGCRQYETETQAQKPTAFAGRTTYTGRYAGRGYSPK